MADLTGQTVDHVKSRFYVQSQNAKNRRLAYTWHFDIFLAPDEKPHDVPISVDLEPVKEGTKMTFKQGPLATAEFTEGSRQGVLANFDRLAKALERKA